MIADDMIIVLGVWDDTGTAVNSVEYYNFDTNTWTEFPEMTETRPRVTAVVKIFDIARCMLFMYIMIHDEKSCDFTHIIICMKKFLDSDWLRRPNCQAEVLIELVLH